MPRPASLLACLLFADPETSLRIDTLVPPQDEVSEYLFDKVAEYKRVAPEHVEFIEAVPKSAAGKILRRELRAIEAARAAP